MNGRRALARDASLVAAAGALQTLAYVWTVAWPLQLACIALLAWRVARSTPRRAAGLGLAYGTAWMVAGTWWLFVSMHFYGGLPAWMAALAVLGLAAFLSLYLAGAMALVARLRPPGRGAYALLFGAAWLLAEWARGVVLTGFPWLASGYAHVDSPLAGYAPFVGVYGIGAIAAGVAAAFAAAREPRAFVAPAVAVVAALVLGAALGRVDFTEPTATLSVTLLQGNVPQNEKFESRHVPEQLDWVRDRLAAAKGDLVVGPETVIPLLPAQLEAATWGAIVAPFRRSPSRGALLGLPLGDPRAGYTNSAAGISAATASLPNGAYRYDKHHLVPFGEFIPTGFKWFTRMMHIPLGDFERGPVAAPSFTLRGERIAPNICYEDLFGEELAVRFANGDATAPTILANLSNIGWFGRTIALDQHLHISRLRTLELQRPMLRATNTGTTAVVDHRGNVTARLPVHTQGVLDATVEGRRGLTPFARWAGMLGLWPLVAVALLAIGAIAASAKPRIARPA